MLQKEPNKNAEPLTRYKKLSRSVGYLRVLARFNFHVT